MFTGFILSFNIRTHYGVNYFNSTEYSIIRTITMVVGELDTANMGLLHPNNNVQLITNYLIYFLFIGLMCTIMLNLFVGIAVGEIKTVLDEADIQQTSMRIMFVLKVQSTVNSLEKNIFFKRCFGKKILNMNFKNYNHNNENGIVKLVDLLKMKLQKIFSSSEQRIILSDPQKRLEEAFNETSRFTTEQIKSIKFGFSNQISDVEVKIFNSQRRIQDSLIEFASNTGDQLEEFRKETDLLNSQLKIDLKNTHIQLDESIFNSDKNVERQFKEINQKFNTSLSEIMLKLEKDNQKIFNIFIEFSKKSNFQFESLKESSIIQVNKLKSLLLSSQNQIDDSLKKFEYIESESSDSIKKNSENLIQNLYLNFLNSINNLKTFFDTQLNDQLIKMKYFYNENEFKTENNINIFKNDFQQMTNELKTTLDSEFKSTKGKCKILEDKLNMMELQLEKIIKHLVTNSG